MVDTITFGFRFPRRGMLRSVDLSIRVAMFTRNKMGRGEMKRKEKQKKQRQNLVSDEVILFILR